MTRRRGSALVTIAAAATAIAVGTACGTPDCAETATCADTSSEASPGDGTSGDGIATTSDASAPEANIESGVGDGADADAGAEGLDGSEDGDSTDTSLAAEDSAIGDAIGEGDTGRGGDASDSGDANVLADSGDAGDASDAGQGMVPCNPSAPDCSNPLCQSGFTCTAAAPTGWFGPVALFDQAGGPPAPTAPACAGAYGDDTFDGNSSPTSPAPACGCTCGSASGLCSNPLITIFSDNACVSANHCGAAGPATCTMAYTSSCNTGGQSAAVTTLPAPTGGGSCDAGATLASLPSSSWSRTGRGCASTRGLAPGGCAAQQVCADRPASPFTPTLCVWQNANTDCTGATGYPLLHKYYTGIVDSRGCALGSCSCGTPGSVTCSLANVTTYNTDGCTDMGTALTNLTVGHCNVVGGSQIHAVKTTLTASGQCTAGGVAAPTGTVVPDPATAVTVCCAQ